MAQSRCNRLKYVVTDQRGKIVKLAYDEAMVAIKKSRNIKSLRNYVSIIKKRNRKCMQMGRK